MNNDALFGHRALLLVLLLTVAVYAGALSGPFQFDDYAGVAVERSAQSLEVWWRGAAQHVRPLTKLSFVASGTLGEALGDLPSAHRIVNLAIHLAAVTAFFALGRVLAATCMTGLSQSASLACSLVGALTLGIHPLGTEAVSYISGRSMALATLLAVVSLLAWIRWRTEGAGAWLGVALGASLAAMLARETAIVTPVLWLAWEAARLARPPAPGAPVPKLDAMRYLRIWLPASLMIGLFAAWLLAHPRYGSLIGVSGMLARGNATEASFVPAMAYFASAFVLLRYPSIDPSFDPGALAVELRWLGTFVLALAAAVAWRLRRLRPEWLIAGCWMLAWIGPLYAVRVRYDAIAERHFYPVIWVTAWAFAVSVVRWGGASRWRRRTAVFAAGLACMALMMVSVARNTDYRSEIALWEAARRSAPDRVRVLNNLAVAYMEAGRWDEAEQILARAVELDPLDERALDNLHIAQSREFGGVRWPRPAP